MRIAIRDTDEIKRNRHGGVAKKSTYTTLYPRLHFAFCSHKKILFINLAEDNDDKTRVNSMMQQQRQQQQQEHDPPSLDHEPDSKRKKQEWLAFRGTRQSRVGADYQVTALPTPSFTTATSQTQEDNPKEDPTNVVEPEAEDSSSDDQPLPRQEQESSNGVVETNQQDHTG